MIRPAAAALVALAIVLAPTRIGAQTGDATPFDGRTDEELAQQGWLFRADPGTPGSLRGGIVALTAGALVRGAGHLSVGDRRTGLGLLLAEPVGIGLVAGGAVLARAGEADRFEPVGNALAVAGASLLAATWATDVLGAFKGGGSDLPQNTASQGGFAIELFYTTAQPASRESGNVLVVGAPLVLDRVAVRPRLEANTTLDYRQLTLGAGWRQPIGRRRDSSLELRAEGIEQYTRSAEAGRTAVGGAAELQLDLGAVFPHVRGLVWTNAIGVLLDAPYFDFEGRRRLQRANQRVLVPVEARLSVNVSRAVNGQVGYRHRRDLLVGGLGRALGVFDLRVGLVPRNRLGFEVAVEQGARTRIWLGVRYSPFAPRQR